MVNQVHRSLVIKEIGVGSIHEIKLVPDVVCFNEKRQPARELHPASYLHEL